MFQFYFYLDQTFFKFLSHVNFKINLKQFCIIFHFLINLDSKLFINSHESI